MLSGLRKPSWVRDGRHLGFFGKHDRFQKTPKACQPHVFFLALELGENQHDGPSPMKLASSGIADLIEYLAFRAIIFGEYLKLRVRW